MPEEDKQIFREVYELYDKWRGTLMETEDQWLMITAEFHALVVKHPESRLALHLVTGIMDHFDEMYRNGNRPKMQSFIGREDL